MTIFTSQGSQGVPGGPKNLKKMYDDIQKKFQVGFVIEKNLNNFCTGCPKSAVRGCKLNLVGKIIS